jgi:transmembrane sensor
VSTESHKKIDAAAGDWFAKRDSGEWTDADQIRFDQWLNESPLNRVAYLRIEHVWERAQRLQVLGAGIPPNEIPPPGHWVLSPFFIVSDDCGYP